MQVTLDLGESFALTQLQRRLERGPEVAPVEHGLTFVGVSDDVHAVNQTAGDFHNWTVHSGRDVPASALTLDPGTHPDRDACIAAVTRQLTQLATQQAIARDMRTAADKGQFAADAAELGLAVR